MSINFSIYSCKKKHFLPCFLLTLQFCFDNSEAPETEIATLTQIQCVHHSEPKNLDLYFSVKNTLAEIIRLSYDHEVNEVIIYNLS